MDVHYYVYEPLAIHLGNYNNNGIFDEEVKEAIKLELGDVLWYVSQLSSELGFELENVAMANLDKLANRSVRGKISGEGDNR